MLNLILGIAGTGKTSRVLQLLDQRAQAGKASVFLVPEQFSSSAEMMVYRALGDEKSAFIEVVSFRTLAERILKAAGGLHLRVLSDAGRVVYLRRALETLDGQLPTFSRYRRSPAFCNICAQTLAELKTAGVAPQQLREIGLKEAEPRFTELALVFEAYETAIQGSAMDPEDRLTLAANRAGSWFADKACFIDNFDGFTAPEYHMLGVMLAGCGDVSVSLCCDGLHETDDGMGRFSPVRQTAQRLIRRAQEMGCVCAKPMVLMVLYRPEKPVLAVLNEVLARGERDTAAQRVVGGQGLTLTKAADEWEEVKLVAAEMHRLALAGVPYSRMALICRDISAYESPVRHAFGLFDIPVFVDAAATIEYTAPVAFLRAALALLRQGLVSQPILSLLKTGLCGYTEEEIAALENYVYTWQPHAADWRLAFEKNPQGLLAGMDGAAQRQLREAEQLRGEMIPILEEFLQNTRGKPVAFVLKQLYLLLDRVGAPQHADTAVVRLQQGNPAYAERAGRAWDLAMELLDQLAALVGEETLKPDELDELLVLLVRSTDFGFVPQSLECAVFTGADRMRLADPDYCFVVGIAEGEFPMQVGYSGLLSHTDREKLVENGVEMPGSFTKRVLLEEMFFYRALTSARQGIYLSWPARRGGQACVAASALEPVRFVLNPPALTLPLAQQGATPPAAYELLGSVYRENSAVAASLHSALEQQGASWRAALRMLREIDNDSDFAVEDTAALKQLIGEEMTLSATRAERYYECRFSYYMQQVLKTKERRRAQISPLESGTFVHYILEKVLGEAGLGFGQMQDEQLGEMAARHADIFIQENLPAQSRRDAFLLDSIKASTTRLLAYLRDAAAQSEFSIDSLELTIGDAAGAVPPLEVETADGRRVRVTGKIDRVDVLHRDGKTYLSIVDYKTGDKAFSLDDVYCGLNMQMMIYMDTLIKNAGERYPRAVPAGVLYLTADPAAVSGSRAGGAVKTYKMDGLLLEDAAILRGLDSEGQGAFLPVSFTKSGAPAKGKQKLAGLEKMGAIRRHVESMLAGMAQGVYSGDFPARPLVKGISRPCRYCPYRAACRHEDGRDEQEISAPEDAFSLEADTQTQPGGESIGH